MPLTHDNIVERLFERFPDFRRSLASETLNRVRDNPVVAFDFFTEHVYQNLGRDDFEGDLANFFEEMTNAEGVGDILNNFCLNIYFLAKEKAINIPPFLNKLTPRTRQIYDVNVRFWERGNGISQ